MRVAVSGATGFIGSALIENLLGSGDHQVVALSRRDGTPEHARLELRACDLYSLGETRRALAGCDVAVYLVHSMSKNDSRLVQGNFEDFDFLLADNFARAARAEGVKHIVYVSGIVPAERELSRHLASRLEVERTLRASGVPVTTFRCGLVIGPRGSSFRILEKLVDRLRVMLLPRWMYSRTQAVALEDVVGVVAAAVGKFPLTSESYDFANSEIVTYRELLVRTMRARGRRSLLIDVPHVPFALSKLWVALVSGVPRELVYPLIESLRHDMLASPDRLPPPFLPQANTSIDEAIERSARASAPYRIPAHWNPDRHFPNEVQSVQRLPLPEGWTAFDLATRYLVWLPHRLRRVISAAREGAEVRIAAAPAKLDLLRLRLREKESEPTRTLFEIAGGALAARDGRGVLEFREDPEGRFAIAAIHRFRPRLPWPLYRWGQAVAHHRVMLAFSRYLCRRKRSVAC